MALPAIAPYPMPSAHDIPRGRVAWTVDPRRSALLIHDMQNYFVDAFDRTQSPIPELVANIARLRDEAHARGIPVFYSAQPPGQSLEQRGLLQDFWGDGIGPDPALAAVIDDLAPTGRDTLLTKWRYSAFVRTDLHAELRAAGRDQLVITGIYAHIGCLMTAAQAFMEEVQPFFVADAVADFSRLDHHMALDYAARRCAVTLTTDDVLGQLRTISREAVRARLLALADEPLNDFGDDEDLSDAGIDSIRLMGVISEWQDAGFAVTFEELAEEPTIAAWTALLARSAAPVASSR
jgi:bifunctional isochorismate lyase/aryl carrier protein